MLVSGERSSLDVQLSSVLVRVGRAGELLHVCAQRDAVEVDGSRTRVTECSPRHVCLDELCVVRPWRFTRPDRIECAKLCRT